MPTTKTHLDQFDIDIAQLGDPLDDQALTMLDTVLDARDDLLDALDHLRAAARRIEAGTFDLAAQDLTGAAMLKLAAKIQAAAVGING